MNIQPVSTLTIACRLRQYGGLSRALAACVAVSAILLSTPVLAQKESATSSIANSASSPTLARIQSSHTLRACIWTDYFGISLRDPNTGVLSGIDIDLAREFARDLDVDLEFVESSFAKLIPDMNAGKCDVAMFGIGITPGRQEFLSFSKPYLQSDIFAITTKSNHRIQSWEDIDKPGVIVAVANGTLHEPIMKEKLKHAELLVVDNSFIREQEVESGRADVFMTDYPYSLRMLEMVLWAKLISPPSTYHMTPYAYAIKKGDDAWLARIDAFVAAIKKDGRLLKAAQDHRLDPIVVLD